MNNETKKKFNQKEIDITTGDIFKSKYGTFDKDNPKVLYLNVKAKVKPLDKKNNYANDIKKVKIQFGEYIDNYFKNTETYSKNFIYSCDVSENNVSFGKKSNLKYEVLVRPVEKKNFDDYSDDMKQLSETLSNKLHQIMETNQFQVC